MTFWSGIGHILGLDDAGGRWYLFWSGIGSDISEFALLSALVAAWRRTTCHVDAPRRCRRLGIHHVDGTPYRTCRRHHPTVPDKISAEHIARRHRGES